MDWKLERTGPEVFTVHSNCTHWLVQIATAAAAREGTLAGGSRFHFFLLCLRIVKVFAFMEQTIVRCLFWSFDWMKTILSKYAGEINIININIINIVWDQLLCEINYYPARMLCEISEIGGSLFLTWLGMSVLEVHYPHLYPSSPYLPYCWPINLF